MYISPCFLKQDIVHSHSSSDGNTWSSSNTSESLRPASSSLRIHRLLCLSQFPLVHTGKSLLFPWLSLNTSSCSQFKVLSWDPFNTMSVKISLFSSDFFFFFFLGDNNYGDHCVDALLDNQRGSATKLLAAGGLWVAICSSRLPGVPHPPQADPLMRCCVFFVVIVDCWHKRSWSDTILSWVSKATSLTSLQRSLLKNISHVW